MSKTITRPPFKCHGGKSYLKQFIIENLPSNYEEMVYVEPYAGAASVLLNKLPGPEEILNDMSFGIFQIFKAIRDNASIFMKLLEESNYTAETFEQALKRSKQTFDLPIEKAVNEYILRRMSRGGLKKSFAWSERLRGGQPGDVNAWKTSIEQIPDLSFRLKNVYIFNKPAIEVIKAFDRKDTLLYVDPPYMQSTRISKDSYEEFEMDTNAHKKLCDVLSCFRGKVVISGYDSELYQQYFSNWRKLERTVPNHSGQSKKKQMRTEICWCN